MWLIVILGWFSVSATAMPIGAHATGRRQPGSGTSGGPPPKIHFTKVPAHFQDEAGGRKGQMRENGENKKAEENEKEQEEEEGKEDK